MGNPSTPLELAPIAKFRSDLLKTNEDHSSTKSRNFADVNVCIFSQLCEGLRKN